MIIFPNAKINLGLQITGKRTDGYHTLETLFYPIPLEDALEILPNTHKEAGDIFSIAGTNPDCGLEENLVTKALSLMRKKTDIPPVKIALYKNIPMGAGMGGGSADAVFTLKLLRDMFAPRMEENVLFEMALQLGADCPFFLYNKPCLGRGIGEKLTPLDDISLAGYHIAVVKPEISISTAEAFRGLKHIGEHSQPLSSLIRKPLPEWHGLISNDFEESLFPEYPRLKELKQLLYNQGAVYASMTGSGSALYGLFREKPVLAKNLFNDCFLWQTAL